MNEQDVRDAADAIRAADGLLFAAGAGMGVDSGLPDFRGNQGFWKAYPPFARLGVGFMDLANPAWFQKDPELAWGFYGHRHHLYRSTSPHAGFEMLREWGKAKRDGQFVFTSNVDGQFQIAGFSEDEVYEVHGSLGWLQCLQACGQQLWPASGVQVNVDEETMRARAPLPACPACGALARPNVLMFGDWGWDPDRSAEQTRRYQSFQQRCAGTLAIVEIGAGSAVPTVRHECDRLTRRPHTTLIRINPREPQVPAGHLGLPGGALETLRRIAALLEQ